jgi:hypothetical protein
MAESRRGFPWRHTRHIELELFGFLAFGEVGNIHAVLLETDQVGFQVLDDELLQSSCFLSNGKMAKKGKRPQSALGRSECHTTVAFAECKGAELNIDAGEVPEANIAIEPEFTLFLFLHQIDDERLVSIRIEDSCEINEETRQQNRYERN